MSHKLKHDVSAKETVLLRQAVPKYNFTGRKLPKEPSEAASSRPDAFHNITSPSEHSETGHTLTTMSQTPAVSNLSVTADTKKYKPVAVVGANLQTPMTTDTGNGKMNSVKQTTQNGHNSSNLVSASRNQDSDKNDILMEGTLTLPMKSSNHAQLNLPFNQSTTPGGQLSADAIVSATKTTSQIVTASLTFLQRDTMSSQFSDDHVRFDQHFKNLEAERDKLEKDLAVQLQVNSELKRLLVASVGDDLSQRVERLCRDRAQLSLDLGGFSKKMSEEYENLDKVSIQADMWRSKYLASRVMIEELGNARAFYALQCHDTQDALQQMLNERHELRTNLLEVQRVLQQVKSAFDPLNSQMSSSLRSTNVLDLSRSCQQLAEAMRFRLLPAHVAINTDVDMDESLWVGSVTRAEQYAHEVLSRPAEPPGSIKSGSSRLLPLTAPPDSQVIRFHPHTRHENLTYNCCTKCKGEINVI